jgi:hypothetical protein
MDLGKKECGILEQMVVVVSGHAMYWRERKATELKQGFQYESRIK